MKKKILSVCLLPICLVLTAIAMSISGCNGGTAEKSAPGVATPQKSTPLVTETKAETKPPVTLKVGSTKAYKTTNRFADYWYGVLTNLTTHDSLIKLDTNMQPRPWLATAWEASPDAKTFVFTIAQNAKWHDGKPLTAEDVRFSIEYYRDRDTAAAWMKDVIRSVSVEGNNVTLQLSRPYGNLLTEFMTYSVLPKHIWEKVTEPLKYEGADRVIGTGPFKFESWDATAGKFIFTANPDYFQGKSTINRLEINVFSNMDALVMALSKGDIDTWWDYSGEFPYTYVPTLIKSGKVDFASASFLGVPAALGFNLDRAPMNNLDFRKAVTFSINYDQIVQQVFSNYGTVPTSGFAPSTHPNYNASLPRMEFKVDEAKKLLDSAGLKDTNGDGVRENTDGKAMTLTILVQTGNPSIARTAEMVSGYLRTVGIASQTRMVDSATWVATKDKMDYDMVFFRGTPWGMLMHASHGSGYFDSRRTGAGVLHNLNNSEYLAACDGRLATGDAQEQAKWDRKLQELHAQYLPGIALAWSDSVYPYNKNWSNWKVDHIYGGVFNSFSLFTAVATR